MIIGLLLAAAAAPAAAAEPGKAAEIVVTGERVKRALKDTPSSVHVITARELQAMPADRVEQVLAGIPNVQLGAGSQGPIIRGQDSTGVLNSLPAFLGGARPRATLEVDGRAVGFQEFVFGTAALWDVQQIEVFRSPLTVTHGRNSIGGGIVVTTVDPTYDWEGAGRVIAGNFSTSEASAAVSGPIVSDQLAFRLSGDVRHSRETVKLADLMRGANPNDDDYSQVRLKLLGQPAALPGLKIVASLNHSYTQRPQDVPIIAPFRKREFPFGGYGIFGVKVNSGTVHATQQLKDGQIEATVSAGDTHTRRYAQAGLGESRSHLIDLSGELFGSWKPAAWITLRGGIHALDDRLRQRIDISNNFVGSIGNFHDRQDSFGAFAEAELALSSRLTLSAGGRYQDDRQRRTGTLVGRTNAPIDFDARFSEFLPKATLSYALTPALKAGLLVQKAYNPGGATLDFNTGGLDTFKAERLWDYEAFVKGNLPGGRVSVEANLFYNDITDAQRGVLVTVPSPGGGVDFFFEFNNIPKASTRGAELEVGLHPSPSLTMNGGIGLLQTRIIDGGTGGTIIGRQFQVSPHLTASASADWIPVKRLRLSAQLRYHSSYFSDDFDTPDLKVRPAATLDARAAYSIGKFTVFAYARNVFDSFHIQIWAQTDPDIVEAEDPRMLGVGLEARF